MRLYKLTDPKGQTHNNTQWGPNVTHTASGEGEMCGPGWLHAYADPYLALLLNPIHAAFKNPQLWEGRMDGSAETMEDSNMIANGTIVEVTREDIDAGVRGHCEKCPIARALSRHAPLHAVKVYGTRIVTVGESKFFVGPEIGALIDKFDDCEGMQPFAMRLEGDTFVLVNPEAA